MPPKKIPKGFEALSGEMILRLLQQADPLTQTTEGINGLVVTTSLSAFECVAQTLLDALMTGDIKAVPKETSCLN